MTYVLTCLIFFSRWMNLCSWPGLRDPCIFFSWTEIFKLFVQETKLWILYSWKFLKFSFFYFFIHVTIFIAPPKPHHWIQLSVSTREPSGTGLIPLQRMHLSFCKPRQQTDYTLGKHQYRHGPPCILKIHWRKKNQTSFVRFFLMSLR